MKQGQPLTDAVIRNAKPGPSDRWLTDGHRTRGKGRLALRVTRAGTKIFYFRYRTQDGKYVAMAIGAYGSGGLSLEAARREVARLQELHRNEDSKDVRAHLEAQAEADRLAQEATERETRERQLREAAEREVLARYTLRRLLEVYAEKLAAAGKQSARDARGIFDRHVFQAFPDLSAQPARTITARDVVAMLRRLTEQGKGRTAGKLRSYLRAAYSLALRAELDPEAPADLIRFDLTANPVAPTDALGAHNRARDRVLSESELRAFWMALGAESQNTRDALRLALLLGGQRLQQLLRAEAADVDLDALVITLRDGKGARKQPRIHALPLCDDALAIVTPLVELAKTTPSRLLFSNDGHRGVTLETLSTAVHSISTAMVKAGTASAPFQMRDLRRTCETMLAALRISSDIRAQIQSHGLGGVQAKHYDRHDYAEEKRDALESWQDRLRSIVANDRVTRGSVVRLRRRRAA